MSIQDIELVENTLISLMNSDNTIRKEAELKLQELTNNKIGLIFCLSNVLISKFKFY
jgi:hypothetical protein